ncbi:MAG: hypothetical protein AB1896_03000 [Thermodesulfobacteriota bacterium]
MMVFGAVFHPAAAGATQGFSGFEEPVWESAGRTARVVFLCQVSEAWREIDPVRAREVLELALREALVTGRGPALTEAKWIRAGSAADEAPSFQVLLELAAAWLPVEPERARGLLEEAAESARRGREPAPRDLTFRAAAELLAGIDPTAAMNLASAVQSPGLRSWAFTGLGKRLLGTDPQAAAKCFGLAFDAAVRVENPLGRVQATVRTAEAWWVLDRQQAEMAFTDAVRTAARIAEPERFAAGLGFIGAGWGRVDGQKAFDLAALIPPEFPEARTAVYLDAAKGQGGLKDREALLEAAFSQAVRIRASLVRDRFLAAVAGRLTPEDPVRALAMLGEISPAGVLFADEVLAAIGEAAARAHPDLALDVAERIKDGPLRARTLAAVGRTAKAVTAGLYRQALLPLFRRERGGAAGRVAAETAVLWAEVNPDEALELAGLIESPAEKARALGLMAQTLWRIGRPAEADRWLNQAVQEARTAEKQKPLSGARVLLDIGKAWADQVPGTAGLMYETACRLAAG